MLRAGIDKEAPTLNPLYSAALTFVAPLVAGYLTRRGLLAADRSIAPLLTLSSWLKQLANTFLSPVTILLSLWMLDLSQLKLVALPAIGLAYHLSGAFLGLAGARFMHMEPRRRGVFAFAGMNSNIGILGGLLSYLFYGETGFALGAFFRLFEVPLYYLVGFPAASAMGSGQRLTVRGALRMVATDMALLLPMLGVIIGLGIGWTGVPRPAELANVNAVLIPLIPVSLAFATGAAMRVGAVTEHARACGVMVALKFAALPALVWVLTGLAGLNEVDGGLPARVAILFSFMPVGFNAVVAATLFRLDEDLANALWLSSTVLLFLIVPLLKIFLG